MQFNMKRAITGGQAADPDPRAAPEDVPPEGLMKCALTIRNSDTVPGRLVLTLEGTAAQTAAVEIWALDDDSVDRLASAPLRMGQAQRAAREFYNATPAAPLTVIVGEMIEFSAVMPGPGTIYVRLTAVPAADAVLKVACAN